MGERISKKDGWSWGGGKREREKGRVHEEVERKK